VTRDPEERRVRTAMAVGMAATFLGLAMGSTFDASLGGVVSLVGWAILAYAVHRLGRLGRT